MFSSISKGKITSSLKQILCRYTRKLQHLEITFTIDEKARYLNSVASPNRDEAAGSSLIASLIAWPQ